MAMIRGAFPLFKLVSLGIKQISKPIADVIKKKAKKYPKFRKYVCIYPARHIKFAGFLLVFNWFELKIIKMQNPGKVSPVPPLTDDMAVELFANLFGEFIVFGICSWALYYEYGRQLKGDAKKQQHTKLKMDEIKNRLDEITIRFKHQDDLLGEIARVLEFLVAIKKADSSLPEMLTSTPSTLEQ